MAQLGNRHVYIFNGLSPEIQNSPKIAIEYMDLGQCNIESFKKAKWEQVIINQSDFIVNEPKASSCLDQRGNEIIVFGGQNNQTYLLDLTQMIASKSVSSMVVG
jgi:hypothetical protein